jgi:UDP-2,3-diacylglucosamine pyrophosphatase LpxH
MLVVASDIHLSDHTTGVVISEKSFSLFTGRLRELAYQASWRSGGRYEPVREIDFILLGDILDPLQSTRWLEKEPGQDGYVRPWHDPQSAAFITKVREITRAILEKNPHAVGVLKKISQGEGIYLPPANRRGKPDQYTLQRVTPRVRIFYMVGNHDWFYHLPGPEYDAIRAEIIQSIGLSNPPGPFPHGPEDAAGELGESLARYRLVARHGDQYDSMSYNPELGRTSATLGDIYSSEVIYRFPFEVARQLGDDLPDRLVQGIQRLANVRPLMATPLWLFEQVRRHGSNPAQVSQVKRIWDQVVGDFLDLDILHNRQFANPHSRNILKLVFGISKKIPLETLAAISRLSRNYIANEHVSLARYASQENAIRSGKAEFVAYGHTHSHEVVPLGEASKGIDKGPLYINTGSWATFLDYSRQPSTPADGRTMPVNLLTCLALYHNGERQGRRFENWWANFA